MAGDIDYLEPHGMAAPGGHYSHAVRAGAFVFMSGQLPISANGASLTDKGFRTQAMVITDNAATVSVLYLSNSRATRPIACSQSPR